MHLFEHSLPVMSTFVSHPVAMTMVDTAALMIDNVQCT